MKKTTLLSVLLLVITALVTTSCEGDETAKKLNGTWELTGGLNQAGLEESKVTMTFNSADMTGTMVFDIKAQGMELMTMTLPFDWKSSSSDIVFTMKSNKMTIEPSAMLKQMAEASGESFDAIAQQTKAEFEKEVGKMGTNEIMELTDSKLVLKEGATTMSFKRSK